jgi:uncharacterized protein HemX
MNHEKERFAGIRRRIATTTALALVAGSAGAAGFAGRSAPEGRKAEKQMTTTQSKFFCNTKALTAEERAHHKQLSEKLMAVRKEIVETEKGYEFQFSPQNVTVAELADWVVAESKCCSFFDFHIDLENEGKLICLRLTGEEGIKQFIRTEFGVH